MSMKKIKFIDIIFYIVLGILLVFLLQRQIRNFIIDHGIKGKEINFSKIKDIQGNEYDLTIEKPVLLVFWASWCSPCVMEIPVINDIYKEIGEKNLILGINVNEDIESIRNSINKHNILYPVVEDSSGYFSSYFKITSIPTIILIKNKKVVIIKHGYSPFLKSEIKKVLE